MENEKEKRDPIQEALEKQPEQPTASQVYLATMKANGKVMQFELRCHNEASAIAIMTVIATVSFPMTEYFNLHRPDGALVCSCPALQVAAAITPQLNQSLKQTILPSVQMANPEQARKLLDEFTRRKAQAPEGFRAV